MANFDALEAETVLTQYINTNKNEMRAFEKEFTQEAEKMIGSKSRKISDKLLALPFYVAAKVLLISDIGPKDSLTTISKMIKNRYPKREVLVLILGAIIYDRLFTYAVSAIEVSVKSGSTRNAFDAPRLAIKRMLTAAIIFHIKSFNSVRFEGIGANEINEVINLDARADKIIVDMFKSLNEVILLEIIKEYNYKLSTPNLLFITALGEFGNTVVDRIYEYKTVHLPQQELNNIKTGALKILGALLAVAVKRFSKSFIVTFAFKASTTGLINIFYQDSYELADKFIDRLSTGAWSKISGKISAIQAWFVNSGKNRNSAEQLINIGKSNDRRVRNDRADEAELNAADKDAFIQRAQSLEKTQLIYDLKQRLQATRISMVRGKTPKLLRLQAQLEKQLLAANDL